MKKSYFTTVFIIDRSYVLFNSLSASACVITEEIKNYIEIGEIQRIPKNDLEILIENGFIVEDDSNERDEYIKEYESRKDAGLSLVVFLSTSCNLGCSYCYQSAPSHAGVSMTMEKAISLTSWVENEVIRSPPKNIHIQFYGGEPLLAKNVFKYLLNKVSDLAKRHKIPYDFYMITNGTLLNGEILDEVIKHNVELQITIDGDREMHDKRRFKKSDQRGTYDLIISNIQDVIQKGGIKLLQIRMNVDKLNFKTVANFAETMVKMGVTNIYCGQVHFRERVTDWTPNILSHEEFEGVIGLEIFKKMKECGVNVETPCDMNTKYTCLLNQFQTS